MLSSSNPSDMSGSGKRQRPRRRGLLPAWLWVLLAALLVVILVILAILFFSGGRATNTPIPTASPSASTTPGPSATSTPTPTTTDLGQGTFDSELFDYMAGVLNSQNTAVLAQGGTFSSPVSVLVANSGPATGMTPDDAVVSMDSMFTPLDPNPWDLALPESVLEAYRSGPYAAYFPAGAIVARSHDGHVFSFIGHDSTITTMFMAASEGLLH